MSFTLRFSKSGALQRSLSAGPRAADAESPKGNTPSCNLGKLGGTDGSEVTGVREEDGLLEANTNGHKDA